MLGEHKGRCRNVKKSMWVCIQGVYSVETIGVIVCERGNAVEE